MHKNNTTKTEDEVLKLILSRLYKFEKDSVKSIDLDKMSHFWVYKEGEVLNANCTYDELVSFAKEQDRGNRDQFSSMEHTPAGVADYLKKSPRNMITERILDEGAVSKHSELKKLDEKNTREKSTKYIINTLLKYGTISPSGKEKNILSRLIYVSSGFYNGAEQLVDVVKTFIYIHNQLVNDDLHPCIDLPKD